MKYITQYLSAHHPWCKYGLTMAQYSLEAHISHWLVCFYLERHPEAEKRYLDNKAALDNYYKSGFEEKLAPSYVYGYYNILMAAEKEILDVHPEYLNPVK